MAESKIIKSSKWERLGLATSNTETTFEVPATGVYWLLTGHNSTPECNTLWVYRSGASAGEGAWQIAGVGTGKITITNLGNNRVKVKSTGGTISVDYYLSQEPLLAMFTNCLSREREKPHVRHYRERRQGAGLSFLPPNRLPKGGLRRKSSDLTDWRAE